MPVVHKTSFRTGFLRSFSVNVETVCCISGIGVLFSSGATWQRTTVTLSWPPKSSAPWMSDFVHISISSEVSCMTASISSSRSIELSPSVQSNSISPSCKGKRIKSGFAAFRGLPRLRVMMLLSGWSKAYSGRRRPLSTNSCT